MRPFLPALALLALGTSAVAGPKPPTTNVFEPEIGYTYASGNYMDLRLANRAGDKAILVHRTGFGKLRSFDLSPYDYEAAIAYVDGNTLFVRPWTHFGGTVTVGMARAIYAGPGIVEGIDFHPNRRDIERLAFSVLSEGDEAGIYLVDIFGNPQETVHKLLGGWNVYSVRWSPNNFDIFFSGYKKGTNDPVGIHRLLWSTDTVTTVIDNLQIPVEFDVEQPYSFLGQPDPDGFAVNAGAAGPIRHYDFSGSVGPILAEGRLAHFNCRNDAIIHRAFATRRPSTRISFLTGGFETWSTDSNIHHTDWMFRVPCG